MRLIHSYKHDDALRQSFNELTREVYGFDFEDWYKKGYWTDHYRCYSLADGERVVANVSASMLDFVVEGELKKAVQIGTVMTHPDYRGRGLSAQLMDYVVKEYEDKCDFIYLFANDTVHNFYPRFGFTRIGQNTFSLSAEGYASSRDSLVRLNPHNEKDLHTVERLVANRVPVCQTFGVTNDRWLVLFYLIAPFADDVYYLPHEDVAVVMSSSKGVLHVYDILSNKPFTQDSILRKVVPAGTERIQLHFTPDGSLSQSPNMTRCCHYTALHY